MASWLSVLHTLVASVLWRLNHHLGLVIIVTLVRGKLQFHGGIEHGLVVGGRVILIQEGGDALQYCCLVVVHQARVRLGDHGLANSGRHSQILLQ